MIRFKIEQKPITMIVHPHKSIRIVVHPHKPVTMFVQPHKSIQMKVEKAVAVGMAGSTYDGSYEIIPTVEEQFMATKDKYMKDDVNIHPIPFYSVSNNSGGNTVFIGSEVLVNGI